MDQMAGRLAMINGVIRSGQDAVVSVYDRGFLYGDSIFETVRTYGGQLFRLDEHMGRLARSAEAVAIPLPVSPETIAQEAREAVAAARHDESYLRIMLSRGSGPLGLDTMLAGEPTRVILVEPLSRPPARFYREGIAVLCVRTVRASDAAHSAKLGNYLASALALRDAKAVGAEEALVVNAEGLVVEGTTSNVFAVRDGTLVTPPLLSGILEGITRGEVLALSERLGYPIAKRALTPSELAASAEVFITSSIRQIVPVVKVDSTVVGDGKPGPMTTELLKAFREHVGDTVIATSAP